MRAETLTVLFTDIVGSTQLATRLGQTAYEHLRQRHFGDLRAAAAAHRGKLVKSAGDGLMFSFAGAADAAAAGAAMQQVVAAERRWPDSPHLQVRIGISAGEVTHDAGDLYGAAVVEAARLCEAAAPDEILASEVVSLLVRGHGVEIAPGRDLELKGLPGPVRSFLVAWSPAYDGADADRIPLPPLLDGRPEYVLAGREAESSTLGAAWARALGGSRQIVLIAGEPGIGKSRLAAELGRTVARTGGTVLYGRCEEQLGVPYQPFVEAFGHFVAHAPGARLRDLVGPHAGELARLVPEIADRIRGLPPPLRADPDTERYRLFTAVAGWLSAAPAAHPLLLIIDDLHWAATPTVLLLRHVVQSVVGARLLIVVTVRDTDTDDRHPAYELFAELARVSAVERLSLRGLDEAGVLSLVEQASGRPADAPARLLARRVCAETAGNPLFAGELIRHVRESARRGGGGGRVARAGATRRAGRAGRRG
jgi:class 3 adenylate cyclase